MNQEKLNEIIRLHGLWMRGAEGGVRADLSNADLRRLDLYGVYLDRAYLIGANLSEANLIKANLIESDLRGADMRNADLSGAVLRSADLRDACMNDTDLTGADLSNADLSGSIGGPPYYSISWTGHGQIGRRLHAVQMGGVLRFSCGCFEGDEETLRDYIEGSAEKHKQSRLKALDIILDLARAEGCLTKEGQGRANADENDFD